MMQPIEAIQSLTLAEMAAGEARRCLALADLRDAQARTPQMAIPGQPAPPTPEQLQQNAMALRMKANGEVQTLCMMASKFMQAAPEKEPELKLAGRLAGLNGKAEH